MGLLLIAVSILTYIGYGWYSVLLLLIYVPIFSKQIKDVASS